MVLTSTNYQKALFYLDGLILLTSAGLLLELLLIDHHENLKQIIPIVFLVGVFALSLLALIGDSSKYLLIQRIWMILTIIAGVAGLLFHAYGNFEFAIEMYPKGGTNKIFTKTIKGATPLLAPGAMIGLGLLGLFKNYIIKTNR